MLLEVNNIRKVYTTRLSTQSTEALKNVNFSVDNGEYVAIMGESGSGKTTLLNILATFDKATSGNVLLNNLDLSKLKDKDLADFRRDNLGFVFQDFNLLDNFSIKDNILLTKGVYAVVRNPIYSAFFFVFTGMLLIEALYFQYYIDSI